MQSDAACAGTGDFQGQPTERWTTYYECIRGSYEKAGFDMPNVIFWNLSDVHTGTMPVEADEPSVGLVSGYSHDDVS